MGTKGGGKGSALAPYGCWAPLSINLWSTCKYLYVTARTDSTSQQSGYLGERETRGNVRESTLERAAAEPSECADYPLLSTYPPNSLHATWRTCTRVQLAEDYRSVSPHARHVTLLCQFRPCNAFRIVNFLSLLWNFVILTILYCAIDLLITITCVACIKKELFESIINS